MAKQTKIFNAPFGQVPAHRRANAEWFKVMDAKGKEPAKCYIYDFIGADFWGEGVSAKAFLKELDAIGDANPLDLHINSPGGDVDEAIAIRTALVNRKGEVVNYIDGLAASCASFIAMNGGKIVAPPAARMMIHSPWARMQGEAKDFRAAADYLDATKLDIAKMYAAKSGKPMEDICAAMDATTYFNAEEAKAFGLVDEVSLQLRVAACAFDLSAFNLPSEFIELQKVLKERGATPAAQDISAQAAQNLFNKELRKCARM